MPEIVDDLNAKAQQGGDGDLISQHLQGDSRAFAHLVKRYQAIVFGYLVRTGVSRRECDDLFQEIFLKVHKSAHQFDRHKAFKPWLFTIAVNTVRSHFRKKKEPSSMRQAQSESEETLSAQPAKSASPLEQSEAAQTASFLNDAIQKLPEAQRQVVHLCCIENLEQAEVSKILKMPTNTIKTHLRRARLVLAEGLSRRNKSLKMEVCS